jgi:CarboxypepD_reg-like domain/Secretion system C-terminal sorting domain/Carboxypeptidase regulatory-like domain
MQKIQLSIPEPCHQNWDKMNLTEQGRFCNACAKQVVDFSNMSDTQVLNYFSALKDEKVCGRAYPDQLERAITMPAEPKKRLFWYWNYITMLFLFFSKSNNAKAQGGIKIIMESQLKSKTSPDITNALQGRLGGIVISNTNIIKGKITDDKGEPLAGVTVKIKDAQIATATDANGFYTIKVNSKLDKLQISAVGFQTKDIVLTGVNNNDIVLSKMELQAMGEVVVTGIIVTTDDIYYPTATPKHIAVLEVKDNATLQPVHKASVIIKRVGTNKVDTVYTDAKGIYKLKRIKEDETYLVKITAEGFKDEDILIKGSDLEERKEVRQIFLEKVPDLSDYKNLNDIIVTSYVNKRRGCGRITGAVSVIGMQRQNTFTDSLKSIVSKINTTIKISPNPVQKGNAFTLTLKLKQTGTYNIQIANAAGQIVLQRQTYATAKEFTQQISTDGRWARGIYYVRITDDKNIFISTSSFSFQ